MIQLFGFRENYYLQHMENGKSNIPKILVVDDEKKWFNYLKVMANMEKVVLDMTYAYNGEVALDVLATGKKFDAILMNIEMPFLNGLAATERIREEDKETPIIAWTCHSRYYMQENCKRVGMNDFIEKNGALLKDILKSLRKLGIEVPTKL